MARYFFDIENGEGDMRDETGLECKADSQVEGELARILSDVVRDEVVREKNGQVIVTVRDENGRKKFKGSLVFSLEALAS